MKNRNVLWSLIPLSALLTSLSANAAPQLVHWGYFEGHRYEVWKEAGISWSDAQTKVSQLPKIDNTQGHLVTITSATEDVFVESLRNVGTQNLGEVWTGGQQVLPPVCGTTPARLCGWQWENGEGTIELGLTYTNWLPNEPNDFNGVDEKYLGIGWQDRFGWNDEASIGNITGYIVEYDIPISATGCVVTGCSPTNGQTLILPQVVTAPGQVPLIGFRRFEFLDPRVAKGTCGSETLTLKIANETLSFPQYLCGSPYFVVEKAEPSQFQVLRGLVTSEGIIADLLPLNVASPYGQNYLKCDMPAGDTDQQHRGVFVWQATNPQQMFESSRNFISLTNASSNGAAAGEFSDHCSDVRGVSRSGSFFVFGTHIDFGVPSLQNQSFVFDSFVALTRYKLLLLHDAVDAAKGVLKNGDFKKLQQQEVEVAIKSLDRGDYGNALLHMENFIKFASVAIYANDGSGFNYNGDHLARAYNIAFMLRDKIIPAVQ